MNLTISTDAHTSNTCMHAAITLFKDNIVFVNITSSSLQLYAQANNNVKFIHSVMIHSVMGEGDCKEC